MAGMEGSRSATTTQQTEVRPRYAQSPGRRVPQTETFRGTQIYNVHPACAPERRSMAPIQGRRTDGGWQMLYFPGLGQREQGEAVGVEDV